MGIEAGIALRNNENLLTNIPKALSMVIRS
jgi:hypothetical protein